MRTQLLSHNKTAYQKVMKAFETSDRTCVVHPTGTGKSYLIAAVSENYKRVLILGPNNFVLGQVHQVLEWRDRLKDAGTVEYMTYSLLNFTESPRTDYDMICLDEFHRAGAPEWGDAVQNLLKINPQAKVFGTTATPIRDNEDNRNMADELFDGNIASVMSIAEAWNRNILPVPTYVTGLFDFGSTAMEVEERIVNSNYLTQAEKRRRITRLNNLRLDWERSEGMPHILHKYLDKSSRRVIVFCANIAMMEQMTATVCGWFRKAGFDLGDVCVLHNDLTYKQQQTMMQTFEDNTDKRLKLMFSVNMLNEGVHVPRVNAVLMLRTTGSRILYMQQLGRCLTAANTDKPVVFDMVDNMSQTNTIHTIRDEFNKLENLHPSEDDGPREFVVHDHCKSYREMVAGLTIGSTNNWESDEQVVARVLEFIKQHGRLPLHNGSIEESRLYDNMMRRREVMETNEIIGGYMRMMKKSGDAGVAQNIALIKEFIAEKGRLPRMDENPYFGKWQSLKNYQKDNPDVIAIRRDYTARHLTDFEATELAERIMDFIRTNGRQPNQNHDKDEKELCMKCRLLLKNYPTRPKVPELREIVAQFRILTDEELADEVILFERENGRMPIYETERALYSRFLRRRERLKAANPEIKALCEKYYLDDETPQRRLEKLKAYCEAHGHLPSRRTAPEEYKNIVAYLRKHPSPEFERIMREYDSVNHISKREFNRRLAEIRKFAEEHGYLPRPGNEDDKKWSVWWERMKKQNKDHAGVQQLIADFPKISDIIKSQAKEKADKKRAEVQARREQREQQQTFTVKQNHLRSYGRVKYGYTTTITDNSSNRFTIYYTSETRRMPKFEESCAKHGLTVREYKE